MNSPILTVSNLNTYFHSDVDNQLTQSLFDVNFTLHKGETLGIIGESGSGKTVTLLSLLGLLDANPGICRGEINYYDDDIVISPLKHLDDIVTLEYSGNTLNSIQKNHSAWQKLIEPEFNKIRGKRVSMIFQNPRLALNPYISIGKQINETIRLHTSVKDKNSAKEKTIEWLRAVKMDAPHIRYNNNPYGLSGGMCQRAMIAMALSAESDIIIADEPTSGLDATIQSDILDLLIELKQDYGKSIIMVSHDLNVMRKITDNLLVYYRGNIIESGSTDAILNTSNNHPYTHNLFNASSKDHFVEESANHTKQESITPGCPFVSHCEFASSMGDKCSNAKPPLLEIAENHKVACWRFLHE